jgi:hypothetical protein
VPSGSTPPNPASGPEDAHTLAELAAALRSLKGLRSYRDLSSAASTQAKRQGRQPALPRATLSDLLNGKSLPARDTVVTFLSACGLDDRSQQPWLVAWERIKTGQRGRPNGAVRVRDARPRWLGVHASIQIERGADALPTYISRDFDSDLRAAMTIAANEGGFILLHGSSSVGKTRSMFEAVGAIAPDWWLLQPADVSEIRALADAPTPNTILWLDDLQDYLDCPGGLPVAVIRSLLRHRVLIVGTLWPQEYASRMELTIPPKEDNDRKLLSLARVIAVPESLTPEERLRAETLAVDDRIRAALEGSDVGVTQTLAAGPEIVRWWQQADTSVVPQRYGKAVITAALDARRVGASAPLTAEFFASAAPAYLHPAHRAIAPADWLDQALAYATTQLLGAASCLIPQSAAMGETAGWTTADYLYQHARMVRRTAELPDLTWQALVEHHNTADALLLAQNAERRGKPEFADQIVRGLARIDLGAAADHGQGISAEWTVGIKLKRIPDREDRLRAHANLRDDVDELRRRADARTGDFYAQFRLAEILSERHEINELRERAVAGDTCASSRLVDFLAQQGEIDELRHLAESGVRYAEGRLADELAISGNFEELRRRAKDGKPRYVARAAHLLAAEGHVDDAIALLWNFIPGQSSEIDQELARLLANYNNVDELRLRADAGSAAAADKLVHLLATQRRIAELRLEVHAGTPGAYALLANLKPRQQDAN